MKPIFVLPALFGSLVVAAGCASQGGDTDATGTDTADWESPVSTDTHDAATVPTPDSATQSPADSATADRPTGEQPSDDTSSATDTVGDDTTPQATDTGPDTGTGVDTGTDPDTDATGCTVIPSVLPPPPAGKAWRKVEALSDEFNGTSLDTSKWSVNSPDWEGRKPARFEESAVSVGGCNLRITASKKTEPWDGWTHNGGLVRSNVARTYGYFEARIKANHTCMSSTFWLINRRNDFSGCDRRVTELDILETVGWNAADQGWIDSFMRQMNSNTHSRNTSCADTPVGQNGDRADIGGNAYEDYHIYAAWWVSPTEVRFYLDNEHVYTITPPAPFDLAMYLRMVVESYDWNQPEDGDDGMTGTWEERTTFYDFVRTWELVDAN